MIIPVRCFTCGKVLADKWREYERRCKEADDKADGGQDQELDAESLNVPHNFGTKFRGKILDDLGLDKICCRRHMLGHVDMIETI